jgi:hypothetical protein
LEEGWDWVIRTSVEFLQAVADFLLNGQGGTVAEAIGRRSVPKATGREGVWMSITDCDKINSPGRNEVT